MPKHISKCGKVTIERLSNAIFANWRVEIEGKLSGRYSSIHDAIRSIEKKGYKFE